MADTENPFEGLDFDAMTKQALAEELKEAAEALLEQYKETTDNTQKLAAWTYKNARKNGVPRRVAERMAEDVWAVCTAGGGL